MFARTVLILFCVAVSRSQNADFSTKLQNGLNILFELGHFHDDLLQTLPQVGFQHIHKYDYTDWVNKELICDACHVLGDTVINLRRNGTETETIINVAVNVCVNYDLAHVDVCRKMVAMYADIALYIIDNKPELNGEEACALLLQDSGCVDPNQVYWNVNIHPGQTVDKPVGSNNAFKILHLTDIHYDGTYTPGSLIECLYPTCCGVDSGFPENPEDGAGYWNEYKACDVPLHTFQAGMDWIKTEHTDIDYVYFTGDIISHRVWGTDRYNNTKDLEDILQIMSDTFGETPVFPVVGNHEPHPVNIWSPESVAEEIANDWIFDVVAELWSRWLPEDTQETIKKGAYYTTLVRPGFRIVALNSNVGYTGNWWLLYDDVDPFGQLVWLEEVLYQAELNNEAVHILSHVPSGDSTCLLNWGTEYKKIVERYSNTITGIFNGHSHKDEMILYHKKEDTQFIPINMAWNGGSYTPYSDKNPNYKIFHIDDGNYDVLDFDVWWFNITEANLTPDQPPIWNLLYSFKEAYGVEDLSANSIDALTQRMTVDHSLLDQYYSFMVRLGAPSMENGCNDDCKKNLLCKIVLSVYNDREKCEALLISYDQN